MQHGSIKDTFTLNNGVEMPSLGFGTAGVRQTDIIHRAAEVGYVNFDTATDYGNEGVVGQGLKDSGIARGDLFITTKVWNNRHGYDRTLKAFEYSLKQLQTNYIDLYLIHWPCPNFNLYMDTWRAMEKLYKDGRIRAIGVANFRPEWLARILEEGEIVPVINQIEHNPYRQNTELRAYCEQRGIRLSAYTPICYGEVNDDPVIKLIGEKYGKTGVQVTLKFLIQDGIAPLPKTSTRERIVSNANLYDFTLTEEEMNEIRALNTERVFDTMDPYTFHDLTDRRVIK